MKPEEFENHNWKGGETIYEVTVTPFLGKMIPTDIFEVVFKTVHKDWYDEISHRIFFNRKDAEEYMTDLRSKYKELAETKIREHEREIEIIKRTMNFLKL